MSGNPEIYLFVSNEDKEIIEFLNKLRVRVKVINVDENNLRGRMLIDFSTNETPLLVTRDAIILGSRAIKEFITNSSNKPLIPFISKLSDVTIFLRDI